MKNKLFVGMLVLLSILPSVVRGFPLSSGTTETRASLGIAETDNVTFNKVTATEGFHVPQSATIPGDVKMYELSGNGTNYVGLKAPDNVNTTYQYVLPPDKCAAGQSLRFLPDNITLECYTPASGSTQTFDMVYNAPDSADNTAIKTLANAVTITGIRGIFTDNTGTISTSASDNVTGTLKFCAPDNVVNCTTIDSPTLVGGTAVSADESMSGIAVVPAYSPIIWTFTTINGTKPFKLTVSYTVN